VALGGSVDAQAVRALNKNSSSLLQMAEGTVHAFWKAAPVLLPVLQKNVRKIAFSGFTRSGDPAMSALPKYLSKRFKGMAGHESY
jgi:hypothetical protein